MAPKFEFVYKNLGSYINKIMSSKAYSSRSSGGPGAIRTRNPCLRRAVLYPVELRVRMARVTGLEPAASGVTGRRSNQLSYTRVLGSEVRFTLPCPAPQANQHAFL